VIPEVMKPDFVCQHFKDNYIDCSNCDERKKVVVEEKRRKFTLENPSETHICRIKIDGGIIQDQDIRKCDYLVLVCENEAAYFVELKGRHFSRAVEQLTNTIKYFVENYNCGATAIFARAVLTSSPTAKAIKAAPEVRKLKQLVKRYGGDFVYGTEQLEE